ncbi:MAG: alanine--tRNA ligase [Armatimonadota bacterium]
MLTTHELRSKYIEFFVSKEHMHHASDSLVPNDPSLLFTSAGMVQFKPYYMNTAIPPCRRLTTAQKCLRTTDIDEVGDNSHLTFFEMMGNFAFGDYFKKEAIEWAWEFLTEVLQISVSRLRVTVFTTDDEAYGHWVRVGVPENKIFRFGEKSNYWPANAISDGPSGPCGPCTEIFFDTMPEMPPTPDGEWDDARWMEIWNLVFTQFNRQDDGGMEPLPQCNIDTGMGLERTATVLAGASSVFDTDAFRPIIAQIEKFGGLTYTRSHSAVDIAVRLVADHVRSTTLCIADGVLPSNEGRGYVLRRLIRRAILKGVKLLGFTEPVMVSLAPTVIECLGDIYPELKERRTHILGTMKAEEDRFRHTIDSGSDRLNDILDSDEVTNSKKLDGAVAFSLYDTYGFPYELTEELAADKGISVDREGYDQAMQQQKQRARGASAIASALFGNQTDLKHLPALARSTEFVGYTDEEADAEIIMLLSGTEAVQQVGEGERAAVILNVTPFYAESGGQVGDIGTLSVENGATLPVLDTKKVDGCHLHLVDVTSGELHVGDKLHAVVDSRRRAAIKRNHTSTHLLQAALRRVVGEHVHQAGSQVDEERLRFDFTHTSALTPVEIEQVELLVNQYILDGTSLNIVQDVPIAEARAMGAMALFGEKYGNSVRVVQVPGVSIELCGGVHLSNTAQAGMFKIISEASVAAGIRRIEAVTGWGVYSLITQQQLIAAEMAEALKCQPNKLVEAAYKLNETRKELETAVKEMKAQLASQNVDKQISDFHGLKMTIATQQNVEADTLSSLADQELAEGVDIVILASDNDGKALFAVKLSESAIKGKLHAGNLIRNLAKMTGGGGGGRADFAQAGGKDASKLPDALATVPAALEAMYQA